MNYRTHMIIALIIAILATVVGWSQSLIYKIVPSVPLAILFPLVVLTRAHELSAVFVSLIQFPLLAMAYLFGIRRWSWRKVLPTLLLGYAILVALAYAVSK